MTASVSLVIALTGAMAASAALAGRKVELVF